MLKQEGIVLIDKPSGWTSHDVVAKIRSVTGIKKVGHAGTLDPLATGLLIVLVGRKFTRLQDSFMKQDKVYFCQAQLGIETDSYDIDGEVVGQLAWKELQQKFGDEKIVTEVISQVIPSFIGRVAQTVPPFSAVKIGGKKLYEKARKGKINQNELPVRMVTITRIDVLKVIVDARRHQILVNFEIACGSGTYIRSLVHDIGQKLGMGATVKQLRRLQIGQFNVEQAQTLDEFCAMYT